MKVAISFQRVLRAAVVLSAAFTFVQCSGSTQSADRAHSSRNVASHDSSAAIGNGDWRPTRRHSIPVVHNAAVDKWIKAFQGPLKKSFDRWVARIGHYGPVIERILDEKGVPRDLIYLAMIESGFNLNAYSSAAAAGPWQFISSTGHMYGLGTNIVDDRRDIEKATRAAATHLADLYKIYGDWYLSFAAYNAGPGKVNSAIRRGGSTDYWKMASAKSVLLRQETKDYVPKILAALAIVKNYRHYGYTEKSFSDPLQYDRVVLTDATDITTIAKCARTTSDVIREMNPALIRGITSPDGQTNVYLPKGARDEFKRNYATLPPSQRMASLEHRVSNRETLQMVAKRYGVSTQTIARLNGISNGAKLTPGQKLQVPAVSRSVMVALAGSSASDAGSTKTSYYKVRRGDTLKSIAKKNKVSESKLAQWNRLGRKSTIKVGMKLKIQKAGSGTMLAQSSGVKRMSGVASIISQDHQDPMEVGSTSNRRNDVPTQKVNNAPVMVAKLGDFNTDAIPEQPGIVITESGETDPTRMDIASIGLRGGEPSATLVPVLTASGSGMTPGGSTIEPVHSLAYATAAIAMDNKASTLPVQSLDLRSTVPHATKLSFHLVKSAETLGGIAHKYAMSVVELKNLNKLKTNTVFVGQKLKVTGKASSVAVKPKPTVPSASPAIAVAKPASGKKLINHKIKSGETLWTLSKKYQVKILDIKKWNALKSDALRPNMTLKIFAMNQQVATAKGPVPIKSAL